MKRKAPVELNPTLADVDTCLRLLREAETLEQLNARVKAMYPMVKAMEDSPALYTRALHIRNLAAYRRARLAEDRRNDRPQHRP